MTCALPESGFRGIDLDLAVAKREGLDYFHVGSKLYPTKQYKFETLYCPTRLARDAWPIIRRERIVLRRLPDGRWQARRGRRVRTDAAPFVAAMRLHTGVR